MFPLPHILATGLSAGEIIPLALVLVGLIILIVARLVGGSDPITHRAYGKLYSGAPGADYENKPGER